MTSSDRSVYLVVARASYPLAVVLLVGVFVTVDANPLLGGILLTTGGVLLVLRAGLMLTMRKDVLEPMAEREARGITARLGIRLHTTYGAVLSLAIGLGWTWIGIGIALERLQT